MILNLGDILESTLDHSLINDHIKAVDLSLHNEYKVNGISGRYKSLLEGRGFTLNEYLSIFDLSIKTDQFHNYKIFQFLQIETEHGYWEGDERIVGRKDFTNTYSPDEQGYLQLLQKTTGATFFRDKRADFRLSSLKGHAHITGQTGSGKSQLMRLLFWYVHKHILKKKKISAILIDIHGDLAKQIKSSSLNVNNDRLIYFSSRLKRGYTPVINPLQIKDQRLIDKTTEFLTEAFDEMLNQQTLSDQMRTILIPCIRTLIKAGDKNLKDLQRFMLDDPELIKLGIKSDFKSHSEFFKQKFTDKVYTRTKNAIYTRIQNLLNYPQFYNMTIGDNTVDLKSAMNGGKIIIFDLAGLGVLTKEAMGRFLVAQIKAIAENRENTDEKRRPQTYLFIDEAQNFLTKSIEKTLNEMRKYKLFLILAHQYVRQLGDLFYPVMSNTLTKVVFYNDDTNLSKLAGYMGLTKEEMKENWKLYECWVKSGRSQTVKIKPKDFLIKRKKYTMKRVEEKELNKKQIERFYKKITKNTIPPKTSVSNDSSLNNKPLYELYLGKK